MAEAGNTPDAQVQEEQMQSAPTGHFTERAVLKGHNLAVTAIQVNEDHTQLVTASRDHTALVWKLPKTQEAWAVEYTRLVGHNHFVSDISIANDSSHLITASWDKTLRLWDLANRSTNKIFIDHKKDILAATFSPCNRHIISCSRDKTVRVWNILGECKVTIDNDAWATCVSCAPTRSENDPFKFAVGFWDGKVKVWEVSEKCNLLYTIDAHQGRVLSVAFAPDGQWLMSGGSDRKVCMFQVADGKKIISFTAPQTVNCIAACPSRAWICAATYEGIGVWDIQQKQQIDLVQPDFKPLGKREAGRTPECTCITWSNDGSILYAGYNNGEVRVWEVRSE